MGKQTIRTRRRKVGGNSGYHTCTRCGGTGRVRNAGRPSKK